MDWTQGPGEQEAPEAEAPSLAFASLPEFVHDFFVVVAVAVVVVGLIVSAFTR